MLSNISRLKDNLDCLYTTTEAADIYGKSEAWFERHRWARTGPKFIKIGRTPYYKGFITKGPLY